jgi:acyl-CoA reductase-like NAD-dependent aldehyde dehydrogenase
VSVVKGPEDLRRWAVDAAGTLIHAGERFLPTARLADRSDEIIECFAQESGYSPEDARALWQDQHAYLCALETRTRPGAESLSGARGDVRHQSVERGPAGRVLVCLPSNAPVPLVAILAACGEFAGNRTIFTRPKSVQGTVGMVLDALSDGAERFALYERSPRDMFAGDTLRSFELVYFMGRSAALPQVAAACANSGTDLIFEAEGNGLAYVGASAADRLETVVRQILAAKSFCNGRMCSAPNSILLAPGLLTDFRELWDGMSADFPVPAIATQLSEESLAWIGARLSANDDVWARRRSPLLVPVLDATDLPSFEFFAPVVSAATCDFQQAFRLLADSRYRLQASYFGSDPTEIALLKRLPVSRLTINVNPADQDPLAPWGSYGRSGWSPLRTFLEKFSIEKLIEVSR